MTAADPSVIDPVINPVIDPTGIDPPSIAAAHLAHMEQAWNRADGAAFGEVFAEVTDFVDIRGTYHRGDRASIGAEHQVIFDSIYAGSTIRYQLEVARIVAPECVVAVASSTLNAPTGPLQGTNRSRLTATITKNDGRWVVTAFQNTLQRQLT